ncbi:hypothetical protein [Luteimonas terrae]|uniref:General secretion pathway protein N n=1 Tax=Luteimonas terrae TaxID=1530191 RepID=A0ABU1XU59_9GAMM|nr:hypothetical protein [Luteimonas terrae]MDR7192301.1 general secretion pathway protein N [Luteimonas terrae]
MRIDATNARTWLVATVGGWALVFALLSLAGLGSRIGALEDDGSVAAPISPMPANTAPAPPLSSFDEVAARPLFSGDRRPHPFFIDPQDEGEGSGTGFDYVLTSVLRTPDFAMAILQPSGGGDSIRLKVGEGPPEATNWLLDSVDARSVVFTTPEGPRTLELRVFDGNGGQPPTPMTPIPPPDGQSPTQAAPRPPAQAAQSAASAAGNGANQPPGSVPAANGQPRGPAGQQATPVTDSDGSATPEAAQAAGPSEAQVEAIRRRIEERRARLRQQQQQSNSAQD